MYTTYFGLREKPFNVTPDPRFFYANPVYREAYASLLAGVQERKGFIVMTGEVGTGKTTLLRMLMKNLEATVRFAYLYNTTLGFDDLLTFACDELDIKVEGEGRLKRIQALNAFLIEQLRRGGTGVLLIDEAQNLGSDVLENLRLLSNLETSTEKLLQIVLVGQPELEAKLSEPGLRQLRQRVSVQCRLDRLKDREVESYVQFRLETAGARKTDLFDDRALERIAFYSTGIPRLINIICDNALLITFATSGKRVSGAVVEEVAGDLGLRSPERASIPTPVATASPPGAPPSPVEPRTTGEVLRRRSLRRPRRRRWFSWVRLGALGGLVVVGGGTLLYVPRAGSHFSAMSASISSAWETLSERVTLARGTAMSTPASPVRPSEAAAKTGDPGAGGEVGRVRVDSVVPTLPARGETATGAPVPSLPPRPSEPPPGVGGRSASTPPPMVVIPPGGTIAEIAFKTYGGYNFLAIDLIKELNPNIADLDRIKAGEPLRLPTLNAETLIRRQPDGSYRLIVGSFLNREAADRVRDRVRRAGYEVEVTTHRLSGTLEVQRVAMTALQTREVAQRAWNTALANCWLQIVDTPCERTSHG